MEEVVPTVVGCEMQSQAGYLAKQILVGESLKDREAGMTAKGFVDTDTAKRCLEVDGSVTVDKSLGVATRQGDGRKQLFAVVHESLPVGVGTVPFEQAEFGAMVVGEVAIAKGGGDLINRRQTQSQNPFHQKLWRGLQKTLLA